MRKQLLIAGLLAGLSFTVGMVGCGDKSNNATGGTGGTTSTGGAAGGAATGGAATGGAAGGAATGGAAGGAATGGALGGGGGGSVGGAGGGGVVDERAVELSIINKAVGSDVTTVTPGTYDISTCTN